MSRREDFSNFLRIVAVSFRNPRIVFQKSYLVAKCRKLTSMTGKELIEALKCLPSEDLDLPVVTYDMEYGMDLAEHPWIDTVDEWEQRDLARQYPKTQSSFERVIRLS